jgi:hypothetical protein
VAITSMQCNASYSFFQSSLPFLDGRCLKKSDTFSYFTSLLSHVEALLTTYAQIAGGFTFALNLIAWYILAGQLLQCVDFPVTLPVGDLSTRLPSASSRARAQAGDV